MSIKTKSIITILILSIFSISIYPKVNQQVNEQAGFEVVPTEVPKYDPEKVKLGLLTIQDPPKALQADGVSKNINKETSAVAQRSFFMNNGSYKTGQELLDYGYSNPNAQKLWNAFNQKYGVEIADIAIITLFYENGTFLEITTGVCSLQYQINGDYRNCVYADINSAGMDAGLMQVNTWYQRYRIAKLGGPSCEPRNSRDITDPCTASQVQWLHNVHNNIMIALDIYAEQGFTPWVGYKRAFKN
jgi:hypothetical protein